MGAVETKVFQKVPPWEAAAAAQNTQLEKEVVQLLWRKWRNDSRSEDGKVDFREFLTLANTIRRQWERWGDSDSESESDDDGDKKGDNESKGDEAGGQGQGGQDGEDGQDGGQPVAGKGLLPKSSDEGDREAEADAKAASGGGKQCGSASADALGLGLGADGLGLGRSGDAKGGLQDTSSVDQEIPEDVPDQQAAQDSEKEEDEDPEMQQLFNLLDRDEDNFLEFSDLLAFIFSLSPELSDAEKRLRSFRFYDRAGNGAIFKEEMLHTLRVLGDIPPDSGKAKTKMPDEIENLFSLMDFAHNGKISEQEFLAATGHYRRLGQLLTIDRWENFRTDMVAALQRDLDLWTERKREKEKKKEKKKVEKNVGKKLRWERRRDEKEKDKKAKEGNN